MEENLDLEKQELDIGKMIKNLESRGVIDIMLADSLATTEKSDKIDNIFIYCAIFLGAVGTFLSFMWGIL